jgi:hypothetical protein
MANNIMAATSTIPQSLFNGQLAGTGATLLYTVPADSSAVAKQGAACNVSGAAVTFSLGIVPSGGSWDGTHTIISAWAIEPGNSLPLTDYLAGACLNAGDMIYAQASAAVAINVLITGTVIN